MEFFVYAFAGVGLVAAAWFLGLAVSKGAASLGSPSKRSDLESRILELERRLP